MTSLFSPEEVQSVREEYGEEALEIFGIEDDQREGYFKHPGGLIQCWGRVKPDGDIVFPVSFNNPPIISIEGYAPQCLAILEVGCFGVKTLDTSCSKYTAWGC